ncbi:MAG TPA: M23 family metallopeptidase [Actinoplanes sp.]
MHPHHPRWRRAATYLTAVCVLSVGLVVAPADRPAVADPRDDARNADRAADRAAAVLENATARARLAARQLVTAQSALPGARRRVAEARGAVAAAEVVANSARRKADTARVTFRAAAGRFAAAQTRVEAAREQLNAVVAASYKGGNIATINLIVDASGPQDAMDRLGLVSQVMENQQDDVDELVAARREARIAQDESGAAKRAAEEAEQAAVQALDGAKAARAAAVRAQAAVVALTHRRARALAMARSERSAVLAEYRAARGRERRIQASLRGWDARQGGSVGRYTGGGRLRMPVHGWKSSDYGMRYDPYYRVWQLHAGTDFAAGRGTPIHAAAAGRVIRAGYAGGYGNYTCINHGRLRGRSLSTCYGHQSTMLVHVGERVRRGEVIGRVGTTGASTGNHLHFEVRLSGSPRNPLNYLPGCLC